MAEKGKQNNGRQPKAQSGNKKAKQRQMSRQKHGEGS